MRSEKGVPIIEFNLEEQLEQHFNYRTFRIGQKEIIEDILLGNDVLGILPTGTGKSICYQLPAKMIEGTTIVVSPLISLMLDQVKQLKANHFKEVVALNSFMEPSERKSIYKQLHQYKLVYVSPELLQQKILFDYLSKITVGLFVIDEAHCISQWGHEFRPDYLKLGTIVERLGNPPVLALSATATAEVQQDIVDSLHRPNMVKHIYPIDRENIAFYIQQVSDNQEKQGVITELLNQYHVPTLIYFSSRREAEHVAEVLAQKLSNKRICFYHGGMEQRDRIVIQQQFMNDQLDVICCTSAFGMGINKPNIRLVIHYHLPPQIESFIQEVGRAGRDGSSSISVLLYTENDIFLPKQLIEKELPSAGVLKHVMDTLYTLHKENNGILPHNEVALQNRFQVNVTQWRFMYFQFEKNGIIEDNRIIVNNKNWQTAYQQITKVIEERNKQKEVKLREMIAWVHDRRCLRRSLYRAFQNTIKEPTFYCCSNCGFKLSDWKPIETNKKTPKNNGQSWQEKLRTLLLIGSE